jgi:hypothetical protein
VTDPTKVRALIERLRDGIPGTTPLKIKAADALAALLARVEDLSAAEVAARDALALETERAEHAESERDHLRAAIADHCKRFCEPIYGPYRPRHAPECIVYELTP